MCLSSSRAREWEASLQHYTLAIVLCLITYESVTRLRVGHGVSCIHGCIGLSAIASYVSVISELTFVITVPVIF